jgi:hypothetical protein
MKHSSYHEEFRGIDGGHRSAITNEERCIRWADSCRRVGTGLLCRPAGYNLIELNRPGTAFALIRNLNSWVTGVAWAERQAELMARPGSWSSHVRGYRATRRVARIGLSACGSAANARAGANRVRLRSCPPRSGLVQSPKRRKPERHVRRVGSRSRTISRGCRTWIGCRSQPGHRVSAFKHPNDYTTIPPGSI